ncbi:MAG: hypothetical protein LUQ44_05815, partial [Methanothrix sp.]|nr:hypothetical protein [Methanothrix sp.]
HSSRGSHAGILCRDLGSALAGRCTKGFSRDQRVLKSSFLDLGQDANLVYILHSSIKIYINNRRARRR